MEEILNQLLADYKKNPRIGKKHSILTILKMCPLYIDKSDFLVTIEIKENNKYRHYYPVYSKGNIVRDEHDIKSMLDIVNFIKYNNTNNDEYTIDGIIVDSKDMTLTYLLDDLCRYDYIETKAVLNNITWLKNRPLIEVNGAIYDYLLNFNNNYIEETEYNIKLDNKFVDLDVKTGELTIIGGRPAMGKTQTAVSLACNEAINNYGTIIYFSGELHIEHLTQRIINEFSHSGILRSYETSDEIYTRMASVPKHIKDKSIYLQDSFVFDIKEYEDVIKNNIEQVRPTMVIIDYLQLIENNSKAFSSSNCEYIMNKLKEIAIKYNVKMIVLSQLNRNLEKRKDKHPILSDIRGSSKVGEIADKVYMLYRDDYYHDVYDGDKTQLEIVEIKPSNDSHTNVYTLIKGTKGGYICKQ